MFCIIYYIFCIFLLTYVIFSWNDIFCILFCIFCIYVLHIFPASNFLYIVLHILSHILNILHIYLHISLDIFYILFGIFVCIFFIFFILINMFWNIFCILFCILFCIFSAFCFDIWHMGELFAYYADCTYLFAYYLSYSVPYSAYSYSLLHILYIIVSTDYIFFIFCLCIKKECMPLVFHFLLPQRLSLGSPCQGPTVHIPPPTSIMALVDDGWLAGIYPSFKRSDHNMHNMENIQNT